MCNNIFFRFIFLTSLFITSCDANKSNHEILVNQLAIELNNSTKFIVQETNNAFRELENKLLDPQSLERASRWQPKAKLAREETKKILSIIERNTMDLSTENGLNNFIRSLKNYSENLKNLDEGMSRIFTDLFNDLISPFNKIPINNTFQKLDVSYLSELEQKAFISKMTNRICLLENAIIGYCNANSEVMIETFHKISILVGQNTLHLKKGDKLDISAGIGAFSSSAKPQIKIDNKSYEIDPVYGIAHCSFIVKEAVGKHSKLVHIEYTNPDGKKETLEKSVEYTVDE